jgi:hypothetical protein
LWCVRAKLLFNLLPAMFRVETTAYKPHWYLDQASPCSIHVGHPQ